MEFKIWLPKKKIQIWFYTFFEQKATAEIANVVYMHARLHGLLGVGELTSLYDWDDEKVLFWKKNIHQYLYLIYGPENAKLAKKILE